MQLEKVRAAFERKSYTPNVYIDKNSFYRILQSLAAGGDFNEQVAEELWAQAAGDRPSNQIRVNDLCMTIVEAQNILQDRIYQTNEQIRNLETQKRKLQSNPSSHSMRRIEDLDQQLDQLYGQKQSFEEDYRLVTQPFGIQLVASTMRSMSFPAPPQNDYGMRSSYHEQSFAEANNLQFLLYLTLGFGFLELIMIYGKYDFLNLIVVTCLLSIYLMNFFDKVYIRFALGLIAISIILDFVWLIMYAGSKWSPPEVSNNSSYEVGYMRFIVFLTIMLLIIKGIIGFYLFQHRNASSTDKYQVSLGLMKVVLDANKSNPFSKQLGILNRN